MYCQPLDGQFMFCQIMVWTLHVLSDHGVDSSCSVRSWMDSSCTVSHGIDSSCTARSWDGQFMYCQIMGWTVHVLPDHGMDSSCTVRSWE